MSISRTNFEMYEKLGRFEAGDKKNPNSKGEYTKVAPGGYLGKYQMGKFALDDAGYYKMNVGYTGKDGINSDEDFLNNPKVQEKAIRTYHEKMWIYINSELKKETGKSAKDFFGKTINEITVTPSGMLVAGHLLGQQRLAKYLKSNGQADSENKYGRDFFDDNGTHLEEYMAAFMDFNVSNVTKVPHRAYALEKHMGKELEKQRKEIANFEERKPGFNFSILNNRANQIDKKNEAILKKADEYYKDMDEYVIDKYAKCKNKNKENPIPHVKKINFEEYRKMKREQAKKAAEQSKKTEGNKTGSAASISYDKNDPFIQGFDTKRFTNTAYPTFIAINGKAPTEQQHREILEGLSSPKKQTKNNKSNENGYWFTTKSGKHIFVPES